MSRLLDGILNSMDKTLAQRAPLSAREKEQRAKQRQNQKEEQEAHRRWLVKVQGQLQALLESENEKKTCFPPVPKAYRLIIHEKAEMNGLVSHSFGREEANRFTFVFKKDHAPTQSQLKAIEFEGMTSSEVEELIERVMTTDLINILEDGTAEEEEEEESAANSATITTTTTQTAPTAIATSPPKQYYREKEAYAKVLQGADDLIVLNTKKRDRRTIEEIQEEMKKKKESDEGQKPPGGDDDDTSPEQKRVRK